MRLKTKIKDSYGTFINEIITEIERVRFKAYRTVNRYLIDLYLFIGKNLYEKVEVAKWGESVVEELSSDLRQKFPEMKGFSKENLWRMKKLYETYNKYEKLSPLVTELSWSHNLIILFQTKTIDEKEFYLKTCINERWSKRELERQIESSLFERFMLSEKTDKIIPKAAIKETERIFKEEYVLDFLGLKDEFSEIDLRRAILQNLKRFFLEFGNYFAFIGEEYEINIDNQDYKIDLLFYHRIFRCLVPVELKIGKFKPEYIGKMQFYLNVLDEKIRLPDENPSVGLILCKSKNEEVVRIAIGKRASRMKIATYSTKIINKKLLQQKLHSLSFPGEEIL
jgi:predicted nuclease of restriction endonuclease-like (RecB) superfamily